MGLSGKEMAACPIGKIEVVKSDLRDHWWPHAQPIERGSRASDYTYPCGPAHVEWPGDAGAWAGLTLHMQRRHGAESL